MQRDIQTDEMTDWLTKPIVAFRNFGNAHKTNTCYIQIIGTVKDMLRPLVKMVTEGCKLMGDKAMKKMQKKKKTQKKCSLWKNVFYKHSLYSFLREREYRKDLLPKGNQRIESRLDYKSTRLEVFIVFFFSLKRSANCDSLPFVTLNTQHSWYNSPAHSMHPKHCSSKNIIK
jgi:hypothetical protein